MAKCSRLFRYKDTTWLWLCCFVAWRGQRMLWRWTKQSHAGTRQHQISRSSLRGMLGQLVLTNNPLQIAEGRYTEVIDDFRNLKCLLTCFHLKNQSKPMLIACFLQYFLGGWHLWLTKWMSWIPRPASWWQEPQDVRHWKQDGTHTCHLCWVNHLALFQNV